MMMLYKKILLIALSLSTAWASGIRSVQEDESTNLGGLFLAATKDIDETEEQDMSWQRDFSINTEIASGETMTSLAKDIRKACNEFGYVESENSNTESSTGELQNIMLRCSFSTDEDYNVAMTSINDSVNAANTTSTSTGTNIYNSGGYRYGMSNQKAMLHGLEMLLEKAETIEQVMLIVPYWSNFAGSQQPRSTSSINVNLNKGSAYNYNDGFARAEAVSTTTVAPMLPEEAMSEESFEEDDAA